MWSSLTILKTLSIVKTFNKLGTAENLNTMKGIYENPTGNILLNGETRRPHFHHCYSTL